MLKIDDVGPGLDNPQIGGASAAVNALLHRMVEEVSAYVQAERLKADATLPI